MYKVKAYVVLCVRYGYCDVRDILQVELIVAGMDSANPRIRCLEKNQADRRLSTDRPHFLKGIMRLKKGKGRSFTGKTLVFKEIMENKGGSREVVLFAVVEGQREALDRVRRQRYCKKDNVSSVVRRQTRHPPHTYAFSSTTQYILHASSATLHYRHTLPREAICIRP